MRPCFNTLTIIEFSHCCIQAAMTSPGLWPALVATAGGDLAVLLQHLHTLHRVTCPHLQLAEVMSLCSTAAAHTFLINGWARLPNTLKRHPCHWAWHGWTPPWCDDDVPWWGHQPTCIGSSPSEDFLSLRLEADTVDCWLVKYIILNQ